MPVDNVQIRPAELKDLPEISAIYNHYVKTCTCTFDTEPRQMDEWQKWLDAHSGRTPALVMIRDAELIGWGCLSKWNNRCAYRFSVENSVYIRQDVHRKGMGRHMLAELINLARLHGHRNIVAQISNERTASLNLHEQMGFREVGILRKIGFKFNRWIDVSLWQLQLQDDNTIPSEN